jgi:signal transduction histidine kinase
MISLILYNLINNATTYQKSEQKSKVIIKINEIYSLMTTHKIEIVILDNGMGIDESVRHKVFEMFFIGTQISKGFGLGLYETKIITELLNGEVGYEQQENWTKFWVRL